MAHTPPESEPKLSDELLVEALAADIARSLAAAAERNERLIRPDDDGGGPWSIRIGEVFDFGRLGRYTVRNRLGRGDIGEVYRAEHVSPRTGSFVQECALKVLQPDARPLPGQNFIDEVHRLSLVQHNYMARYQTYFLDQGRHVLVMDYVEGRSLRSILKLARRKGRTLSVNISRELLTQIAEALAWVHDAKDERGRPLNIVHRDISPSNIMVTSAGYATLVDFGIAQRGTQADGVINPRSPYLSPEQVELRPLDGRSDLFSLCCVLVEMITGEPPFGRTGELAPVPSAAQVTRRYVNQVTRGLPRDLRALCRKALARDPARRFRSGREMARALYGRHDYQGPPTILKEIASLEALPDATPKIFESAAKALRGVKRTRRARSIRALALASLGGGFLCGAAPSRPPAPATPPPAAAVSSPETSADE